MSLSSRRVSGEVFVPLSQPAGEAQFDFGEATVEIAGVRVKAALAVMTLPYSDAFFVSAYPRECTETFQAGHVAAFAFFGGVPTKTAYDNTKIAVSRIVGPERADAHAGVPAVGEPLSVHAPLLPGRQRQREGPRREPASATAAATSWCRCRRSGRSPSSTRTCGSGAWLTFSVACAARRQTKAELLADDQAAMLPLPDERRSSLAGSSSDARTRCRWCASTATTTRSRQRSPITS